MAGRCKRFRQSGDIGTDFDPLPTVVVRHPAPLWPAPPPGRDPRRPDREQDRPLPMHSFHRYRAWTSFQTLRRRPMRTSTTPCPSCRWRHCSAVLRGISRRPNPFRRRHLGAVRQAREMDHNLAEQPLCGRDGVSTRKCRIRRARCHGHVSCARSQTGGVHSRRPLGKGRRGATERVFLRGAQALWVCG